MKLKTLQERNLILQTIYKMYGGKKIELNYETPFQLLCAVMLSAQTTDKQVNKVTPYLFDIVKKSDDILLLSEDEIMQKIQSINYFRNKSRFLRATAQILTDTYHSEIPRTLAEMITLPGVGIKTAKVVLSVLYDFPFVGVDTHIHRICNRIGFFSTKSPGESDKIISKKFSEDQKRIMHHPLVLFGRYTCKAIGPKCSSCPITDYCNFFKQKRIDQEKGKFLSKKTLGNI